MRKRLICICLMAALVGILHAQEKEQDDSKKQADDSALVKTLRDQADVLRKEKEARLKTYATMAPERTIGASAEKTKPLLMLIMQKKNYVMDTESQSQLVFSQDKTDLSDLAENIRLGLPYPPNVREILRFMLIEQNGKTMVSASGEMEVQEAGKNASRGRINNPDFRVSMQLIFDSVEDMLQKQTGTDGKGKAPAEGEQATHN